MKDIEALKKEQYDAKAKLHEIIELGVDTWDYSVGLRKNVTAQTDLPASLGFWMFAPSSYTTKGGNCLVVLVKSEGNLEVITTPWFNLNVGIQDGNFTLTSPTWDYMTIVVRKIR